MSERTQERPIASAAELLESAEYFAVVDAAPRVRVQIAALEAERQQLARDIKRMQARADEESKLRETIDGKRAALIDECEHVMACCQQLSDRLLTRIESLKGADDHARAQDRSLEQLHHERAAWALQIAASHAAGGV
jgi:chromosome segregation ATPase